MPRKIKKTVTEETIPDQVRGTRTPATNEDGEPGELDLALETAEDIEALSQVLGQFGDSGVTLKCSKLINGVSQFVTNVEPENLSTLEQRMQLTRGGGDYTVRIYINGQYRVSKSFSVAPPLDTEVPKEGARSNGGDHHSEFLEKLILGLLVGGGTSKQPPGPSILDLTAALANLDGLRTKPESEMATFQRGIEFAMKLNGKTDWKTDLLEMGKEALPGLMGLFNRNPQTPPPQVPATTPGGPTPPAPGAVADEQLKLALGYLKSQCVKGLDPGSIIDWVVNNAEQYQGLIHVIFQNPFDKFVTLDPEIGTEPFKSWFTSLYDGLRQAFTPDDRVDDDSPGNVGDTSHVGSNGKSRKKGNEK